MTLKQMQTLLPLIKAHVEGVPGAAYQNPIIQQHEAVLDNLTPFSVPPSGRGVRSIRRKYWVLDREGRLQREFEA